MRILFIGKYGSIGGAENVMRSDIQLLSDEGCEIVVIYGDKKVPEDFQPMVKKYYLKDMSSNFTIARQGSKFIFDIIVKENPDIVHFHNVEVFEDVETIKKVINKHKTVITAHTHYLDCPTKSKSRLLKGNRICERQTGLLCIVCKYIFSGRAAGIRTMWRRYQKVKENIQLHNDAARVVVMNEYMKRMLLKIKIQKTKISIITPSFDGLYDIRNKGYKKDFNKILFVGRISDVKGAQFLLQASQNIIEKHTISIIGEGDYLQNLKELAKTLNIEEKVVFHGAGDNRKLQEEYTTASVMVVPSICPETFGLIGQEAISYGLPVVAFDVGGISTSWCFDNENGYLVKPCDVKMLANRINRILEDKELAKKMSVKSREIALDLFDPEKHRNSLIQMYNNSEKGTRV
ncbi:MAG: glycosyltransferase family 4 protein [Candidatus Omnitrophota bacterium]